MSEPRQILNPPKVPRVRYPRNLIKTAVCELRFPTLLEIEEKPPRVFQQKIRKLYPFYEPQIFASLGNDDASDREHRYLFRSKDQKWTISLKSSAIAIETKKYVDFQDFFSRLTQILESAKDLIDSDFFTRVGLRYINEIQIEDGDLNGWVRDDLVLPLVNGVLGEASTLTSVTQGYIEGGQYTFRQAFNNKNVDTSKEKFPAYVLDTDYFQENVEFKDVSTLVQRFNEINFYFFNWCLGEKAKKSLGEGKAK